jgi:endonuclease-3 related protein
MDDKEIGEILRQIYRRLFDHYGPQHWWPAEEPFEVIVGAILTQSAAWTNVEKAIAGLKDSGKMTPEAIRRLPHAELARIIHSSGYYNAKASKLHAFVRWLKDEYDDDLDRLFDQDIGELRRQLLAVHGIGEETADSIILYAANKPVFVIDAYTRRIIQRIGIAPGEHTYAGHQTLFTDNLDADTALFNEYHALLVRLGKEVCRKKPLCDSCCLNSTDKTATDHLRNQFPCSAIN